MKKSFFKFYNSFKVNDNAFLFILNKNKQKYNQYCNYKFSRSYSKKLILDNFKNNVTIKFNGYCLHHSYIHYKYYTTQNSSKQVILERKKLFLEYINNNTPLKYSSTNRLLVPYNDLKELSNLTGLNGTTIIRYLRQLSDPPQILTNEKKLLVKNWILPFIKEGKKPSSFEISDLALKVQLSRIQLLHLIKELRESRTDCGVITKSKKDFVKNWLNNNKDFKHKDVVQLASELQIKVKQCHNLIERLQDPSGYWTNEKEQYIREQILNNIELDEQQIASLSKNFSLSKRQIRLFIKKLKINSKNPSSKIKTTKPIKWKEIILIRQWIKDNNLSIDKLSDADKIRIQNDLGITRERFIFLIRELKESGDQKITTDKKHLVIKKLKEVGFRKLSTEEYAQLHEETQIEKYKLYQLVYNLKKLKSK